MVKHQLLYLESFPIYVLYCSFICTYTYIHTALHSILYYREGYVEVARILLEAGSDVETPDNYGQSPLFMACWKGGK